MDRFKNTLVAASPGHLEPMTLRAAVKLADTNEPLLIVLDVVPARYLGCARRLMWSGLGL